MLYRVGVNDIEPDHWLAHVFDLDGCFSKAATSEGAIAGVPAAIREYFAWLKRHEPNFSTADEAVDVVVAEDIRSVALPDGYFSNAFFEDDRRVLNGSDIDTIRRLLVYTRQDLTDVIDSISPEQLDRHIEREVTGSIKGVINHIATAEWWYCDRLDMALPRTDLPEGIADRLRMSREHSLSMLPALVGMTRVTEKRGEKWSARKVLRRTLWHEIAHTRQIQKYFSGMR
jgi:hypothetical protein